VIPRKPTPALSSLLWSFTILLCLIGIAIVTRRTVQIFAPSSAPPRFPEAAELDAGFTRHPILTMIHILPGLLFIVLAPLQFVRTLRVRRLVLHRWTGRVLVVCGLIVGCSALVMSPQMAIGGANETAATTLFAVIFLFALVNAWQLIRQGKVALHREWMIRAFAVGSAVAATRPIMGAFFATRRITHLTPHDFFGIAFWLSFTIQLIAAEVWINYTRPQRYELAKP